MIQDYLRDELANKIDSLEWTVDYFTAPDNTGTVYVTDGRRPDVYDTRYRFPSYQVYIRSSNWDKAQEVSEQVLELLHRKNAFEVYVPYKGIADKRFFVFLLEASTDPIRVGDDDGVMQYSINFDATIREMKEENANA